MVENIGLRAQKHARGLRRNPKPGTCPHERMTLLPCNARLIPMGEVQLILPCAPPAQGQVGTKRRRSLSLSLRRLFLLTPTQHYHSATDPPACKTLLFRTSCSH